MAKPKFTDFSHLAGQTATAMAIGRQMTDVYHRAAGVRVEDEPDLEDAAKPDDEREPSDADELVEKMRRSYNRGLGHTDDERDDGEDGDGRPREDNRKEARATRPARAALGAGAGARRGVR